MTVLTDASLAVTIDTLEVARAVDGATDQLAAIIATAPTLRTGVPGLRWSVGETVSHVCYSLDSAARILRGENPSAELAGLAGAAGLPRLDHPCAQVRAVHDLTLPLHERSTPEGSAEALRRCSQSLVAALRENARSGRLALSPWYGSRLMRTEVIATAAAADLLLRGPDLARASGCGWRTSTAWARAVAPAVLHSLYPLHLRADRRPNLTASVEMRIIGARPFVITLREGTAASGPKRGPADASLTTDARTALQLCDGRLPLVTAVLTRRVRLRGPRPWTALVIDRLYDGR